MMCFFSSVQAMVDCDGESLVSSGVDHLVIVWRVSYTQCSGLPVMNS